MKHMILLLMLCGCTVGNASPDVASLDQARQAYQAELVTEARLTNTHLADILDVLRDRSSPSTLANNSEAHPPVMDDEPLSPNVPLTEEEFADLQKSLQKSPPDFGIRWVTVDGESLDADDFIGQWYRRNWTYPGTIDSHLIEHGVRPDEIRGWTQREKEQLHAAIHERERSQLQTAPRKSPPATVVRTYSVQSCPGGVCPAPSRRGLFGRRIR